MLSINCPYCRHVMELKGVRPGQFQPACRQCKKKFLLAVWADDKVPPTVAPLPQEAQAVQTTVPVAAAVGADITQSPSSARTIEADEVTTPPASYTDPEKIARHHEHTVPPSKDPYQTIPKISSAEKTIVKAASSAYASPPLHMKLGGYEILRKLSEGGMGSVYLAKQTSLDRNVALKVLSPKLACDPQFVSRFTREAFAAAQLSHHNVVQIHDIGVERSGGSDTNYFSMEFVEGKTLGGMVKDSGKLDPDAAVGYVLQAARGLKFAHDHGLIHRDVKPNNLLLNPLGIVKVADLGLVKLAGVAEPIGKGEMDPTVATANPTQTLPSVAMGTPAYMPPEQAKDAATVDWRADIYSLGCTLYDLLTGRPPFVGKSAAEIITKHASEPVVPPDRLESHVPPTLSKIVTKMLAKKPEERFANMTEVIVALEQWAGVWSEQPFTPPQEQQKVLEFAAERFSDTPWKRVRTISVRSFFALMLLAIVGLALPQVGYTLLSAGLVGFTLATIAIYQIIYGIARSTFIFRKFRELIFASSFYDWLTYGTIVGLAIVVLWAFNLLWVWLGFAVAAMGVAIGFYAIVDRSLKQDRQVALDQAQKLIKDMRLRGLDENTIRKFVCKYAGKHWEEFYECLFGYEAKILARQAWSRGEIARSRPKFAAWREPLIQWMDRSIQAHKEHHQQKMLTRIETEALEAAGVDEDQAVSQAKNRVRRLMEKAVSVRTTATLRSTEPAVPNPVEQAAKKYGSRLAENIPKDWMDDEVPWRGRYRHHESYLRRRYGGPLDMLFGRELRLIASMMILLGFGLWFGENGGRDTRNILRSLPAQREDVSVTVKQDKVMQAEKLNKIFETKVSAETGERSFSFTDGGEHHLSTIVANLPAWLCDAVGCWNGAMAGGLLLLSMFFAGRWFGAAALLAAAAAIFGNRVNAPFLSTYDWAPAATAAGLWLIGVIFLREPEDR